MLCCVWSKLIVIFKIIHALKLVIIFLILRMVQTTAPLFFFDYKGLFGAAVWTDKIKLRKWIMTLLWEVIKFTCGHLSHIPLEISNQRLKKAAKLSRRPDCTRALFYTDIHNKFCYTSL